MSASYSYSINCAYYMDLYGCIASCDMLPPPPIPRRRQCGMPHPALTQAWAHKGLCLAPVQGSGPGPGPSLSTADPKKTRLLKKTIHHVYCIDMNKYIVNYIYISLLNRKEKHISCRVAYRENKQYLI